MHGLEVYSGVLTPQICNQVIDLFQQDSRKIQGQTCKHGEQGVHPDSKLSTEIHCNFSLVEFEQYNALVLPGVRYLVTMIKQRYLFLDHIDVWSISPGYNIQYYGEDEGYFTPHCEQGVNNPRRMLAWMIYLNDAECGTEFPYQQIKLQARQGNGAIWSAAWTHPHKGVTPNKGDKYIVTGWCEFVRPDIAQQLKDSDWKTQNMQGSD